MTIFYIPITVIALCAALYFYFTRTFNYWKKRNVPGPEPTALFGNFKESALRRKNIGLVVQDLYNAFPNEKVVGIYRMTTPSLLIRDLDVIKHIMIKDFELFADRGVEFSKKGLGQNLFHADGDTWRGLRNRFTPIFTSGKLKRMYYLMHERADKYIEFLQRESEKSNEFEVHSLVQKFTVSTITACAFGLDINTLDEKVEALEIIDKMVLEANFGLELDMMYPGILKKLGISLFPSTVLSFFSGLVKNVVSMRNGKPTSRNDFMDLMLGLREMGSVTSNKLGSTETTVEITDDVLAAQAFVFYVGGYETSATTVSYLLYQLALNQDVQEKVIQEVDEVLKENNGEVTYDCLMNMKYLTKVFDETLRMYSIVEPLQRKATVDYKIPGTDVTIEKGTVLLISPRGIHYDEKYYPKPEVFDPNRFDADVAGSRHPCAYLPFGLGQRNCIGMRFGRLQSVLCVVKMLSKFRIEPSKNTTRDLRVKPSKNLIGPDGGIHVNIVPRRDIKT
ncbi:unnamed protein product [Chrysodeixis includens]|uniref:unspecific monooxygenase n=1 Tax=Chrysodeixis includens TaxID=689277 RepID=A0A9P0BNF4_CHRIL|nr:unnamed protein product [Chrysodeixis includens]